MCLWYLNLPPLVVFSPRWPRSCIHRNTHTRARGCILSATSKPRALHYVVDSQVCHTSRHCITMLSDDPGYHNRRPILVTNISDLLCSLNSSTYDDISPKVEYWIEYVFREGITTVDELVEGVSSRVWNQGGSYVVRFFKEFFDAPLRSEQARSFVDKLCELVLRWFAVASAENISSHLHYGYVAKGGEDGLRSAASFVGYLIEYGLLGHDLVRRHLIKPLIAHHYADSNSAMKSARASAVYQLFIAAGSTLLQGLLEPEDVQACFELLDTPFYGSTKGVVGLDAAKLKVHREFHPDVSHCDLTCGPGTSRDPH